MSDTVDVVYDECDNDALSTIVANGITIRRGELKTVGISATYSGTTKCTPALSMEGIQAARRMMREHNEAKKVQARQIEDFMRAGCTYMGYTLEKLNTMPKEIIRMNELYKKNMSADGQKLIQSRLLDRDFDITDTGRRFVWGLIVEQYMPQLLTEADRIIAEQAKENA